MPISLAPMEQGTKPLILFWFGAFGGCDAQTRYCSATKGAALSTKI